MPAAFRPNPNFEAELRKDPGYRQGLSESAKGALAACQAAAPHGATDHYAESFVIADDGENVTIGNTDFAAHLVEWGSVNNPAYAPLRRGVRAAGLRLAEDT